MARPLYSLVFRHISVLRALHAGCELVRGEGQISMGTMPELFGSNTFDPETIKILSDAYDRANNALHDHPTVVDEAIAGRIISLAKQGVRDLDALVQGALKGLGDNKAG